MDVLGTRACMRCGYDEHWSALEFHHLDPATKRFNVTAASSQPKQYPWEEVVEEIKKCDLLCANCHAIATCREVLDANVRGEAYRGQKEK